MTQLLSPKKTAELLGVTVGTLAVWRCQQRYALRFVKIGSKIQYRARRAQRAGQGTGHANSFVTRLRSPFTCHEARPVFSSWLSGRVYL